MTDLEGRRSETPVFKVMLAGEPVLSHHVELLASMLDDHPLAERLKRGLVQRNSIVTITTDDREHLIQILGRPPPSGLAALQSVLQRQQERLRRRPANY